MKMVNWLWKKSDKKEEEEVDEDELKKKGFNPEGLDVEDVQDQQLLSNFDKDYEGFICPTPEEAQQIINAFKCPISDSGSSRTTTSIGTSMPIRRGARSARIRSRSTKFGRSARR